jgi:hypothetical protein
MPEEWRFAPVAQARGLGLTMKKFLYRWQGSLSSFQRRTVGVCTDMPPTIRWGHMARDRG